MTLCQADATTDMCMPGRIVPQTTHTVKLFTVMSVRQRTSATGFVEMKLDCCVFLWKLSFLKTLEITTPLKSGPQSAQPLIFNRIEGER